MSRSNFVVGNRVQRFRRKLRSSSARHAPPEQTVVTKKDIVQSASIGSDQDFLKNCRQTELLEHPRRVAINRAPVDADRAPAWRDHAGEKLDQRTLAGTILAEDRVNRGGRKRNVRAVERDGFAVGFGETVDFEHQRPDRLSQTWMDPHPTVGYLRELGAQ